MKKSIVIFRATGPIKNLALEKDRCSLDILGQSLDND